jgi:lysophospholipase L1-like esterase
MPTKLSLVLCLLLVAAAPARSQTSSTWFLAEGASNALFDQDILVANPNTSAVTITITLLPQPGALLSGADTKAYTLGALSRGTYNLKSEFPSLNGAASARVSATTGGAPADIIVERSMYFPDANRAGGHNASGVTAPAERWILAEGASTIFNTFILVTNPNSEAVPVRVTYLRGVGTPVTFTESIPANSRRTFWPQVEQPADLGNAEFSTVVESLTAGKPIVAERAMYFDYPGPQSFARSGHDALGVPAPSTTWYFAEGNTGGNGAVAFETFLLLANQNDTPTDVTVTFHLDSGEALSRVYAVPARARYNVWVDDQGRTFDSKLLNAAFGISVLATQPIVAERAMYWGTPSSADPTTPTLPWREGHATAGAPGRATRWGFAEGAQDYIDTSGTRYQTFLLLSNPNPTPIVVRATFLRSDGTGIQRDQCVPGNGRQNIWTASYPELSNQRFASFVETVATTAAGACGAATAGGEEFVAERAMYWADGFTGGHVNIGTPWTGAITAPAAPNFTLSAALSTPTTGRLSGGQWVDLTVQNVAADAEVWFGTRKASAVQFVGPQQVRALTPVRTKATGFGNAGPVSVEVKSAGRTAVAGTFTFTFNVLAFGDSITYGISNFYTGDVRIPVNVAIPYPLQVKNRLQAEQQFGSHVRVTNAGWPGEVAIGYGEARLLTCLAGGSGCLSPGNNQGYTPTPRPADFVTPFDVVVILEGVNDVYWGSAPSQVRDALKRMADSARARGVAVVMTRMTSYKLSSYVDNSAWLPAAQQMNSLIWTLTEQEGLDRVSFDVDMCPDGLHPTDWGYGQMGFAAATKLLDMFKAVPAP